MLGLFVGLKKEVMSIVSPDFTRFMGLPNFQSGLSEFNSHSSTITIKSVPRLN